ncbi:MFS transporter [Levilactobacillus brevis]|nr:MFS transporter [Levilactobacillus brevis]
MLSTVICFYFLTRVTTITGIIINWSLFQVALNMMVAPLVAFIADKAPKKYRGSISAFYGVGMNIGTPVGTMIASRYITNVNHGIYLFMVFEVIFTLIGLALVGDGSNQEKRLRSFMDQSCLRRFLFQFMGTSVIST